MNIYKRKQRWKIALFISAIIIVLVSLAYTNVLVNKIAKDERNKAKLWADAIQRKARLVNYTNDLFNKIKKEERKRIEIWAKATKLLSTAEDNSDLTFYIEIASSNTSIPVILTDQHNNINSWLNIDSVNAATTGGLTPAERQILNRELRMMKLSQAPIEIPYYKNYKNYLYYKDSKLFSELKVVLDDLIKSFISEVAINSASVPVIFTDSTRSNIIAFGNIDTVKMKDPGYREKTLAKMASENVPIEIEFGKGYKNYIFYQESFLLTQLKYYPFVQLIIVGLFFLIAYTLFSTSRKAEQNQVWVGMAKETAHQLGTPLSSLIAWLEYLKLKGVDDETTMEIEKDIRRLETITERFSKIGSVPVLQKENLIPVLQNVVDYIKLRTSQKVNFSVKSSGDIFVPINVPLFEWVIENICRNAVDAMDGVGDVTIVVSDQAQFAYIDIIDTGKGISKSKFRTVFEPGYTTKKRGWGLGLSLTKRIIENYHSGKIFVKRSEMDKGTTFRIVLNK